MASHSEHHAQNAARGHKANPANPNTSESKEKSRKVLDEFEGTADGDAFVAGVGSKRAQGYDGQKSASHVNSSEKTNKPTTQPARLYDEDEFSSEV